MASDVDDMRWMRQALESARKGEGSVEPNPMVGCVIVSDGALVAEGFHRHFGGDHAEVAALKRCPSKIRNATLFVTLEPCCHQGKTPPCSKAIIDSGKIRRVVVAQRDPFPQVAGGGIEDLKQAGIEVELGVCEGEAQYLNAPYLRLVRDNRPWVHAKWAMTLDGRIATRAGSSQWISGAASRARVHELRGKMDAIIVGKNTALHDDPLLTARPAGPRVAIRVVLDSQGQVPLESQLVATAADVPTWFFVGDRAEPSKVACYRDRGVLVFDGLPTDRSEAVSHVLCALSRVRPTNILVEGGGELLGAFNDAQLIDEVHVFMATKVCGGRNAISPVAGVGVERMDQSLNLVNPTYDWIDGDVYVRGRVSDRAHR